MNVVDIREHEFGPAQLTQDETDLLMYYQVDQPLYVTYIDADVVSHAREAGLDRLADVLEAKLTEIGEFDLTL